MNYPAQRRDWALAVCQQAQMRLTPIRERLLAFLAACRGPVSLEAVMQAEGLRDVYNATTAYRTLMLFKEIEVIRQVSLPDKQSYFVLNLPGERHPILICRCCGQIAELPVLEAATQMERELAATRGYARLYHELQFFGVCPACQQHPAGVVCAKLQPRRSSRRTAQFPPS